MQHSSFNPHYAKLYKLWIPKGFFNLKSSKMFSLSVPVPFKYLCQGVYGHYNSFNSFSAGIDFKRRNETYVDVKFWRLKSLPALKGGGPRVVVSTAAFHARVRGSIPSLGGLKETKMFLPHPLMKLSIVGNLSDREVACSVSDLQGLNFESCVWRTVSSQSSRHTQEVLLAQFSLYVHKRGLKSDSFHLPALKG